MFTGACIDTGHGNWRGRYADTRHMYSDRQERDTEGEGRAGVLIYSHVLAIVSPEFDCSCCLENYESTGFYLDSAVAFARRE